MTTKKTANMLMAEDDTDFYRLMTIALNEVDSHSKLRRVEDGEELMDYLMHRNQYTNAAEAPLPDIIFLDLNMPRKNGLEALKEIKSHPRLKIIPVIMLTLSNNQDDAFMCYSAGVNSFVTKPIEFDGLVKTVKLFQEYWFEAVTLTGP